MPLKITGELTATTVEHTGAVLPVSTPVPSTREAVEAVGLLATLLAHNPAVLVHGELVPALSAVETLRRFVLTR